MGRAVSISVTLASAGLAFGLSGCSASTTVPLPPNIIFFLVDDMGWQDTSLPFWSERTAQNELYRTPHMERLASEGVIFTQAYSSAVCSPTRVSILTGMHPARHRVTNWTLRRNFSQDIEDHLLGFPTWNMNGLQPVDTVPHSVYATTLPQILRLNGYVTLHVGKAHWGAMNTPGSDPLNLGFDVNIAGHAAGAPGSFLGERNFGNSGPGLYTPPWGVPGLEKYHGDTINLTHALTLEAIEALEKLRGSGQPFFLHMSHYTVHTPIEPDFRYYSRYIDQGLNETEARYASMIEGMDQSLGDLMDYLDRHQLSDNTIIIFTSDNGGLSAVARGGEPHLHNLPLRSGKGSAYEGGTRVPMLVKWPGTTAPGTLCSEFVMAEDYFPTLLEMAGISTYTTAQVVDGVSFVPLLKGANRVKDRHLVWHYPNKWGASGPGIGTTSSLRRGDWKLIYWYATGEKELYNLKSDLGETTNLAASIPDTVNMLSSLLGDFLREVNADRPIYKENMQLVPWPDER